MALAMPQSILPYNVDKKEPGASQMPQEEMDTNYWRPSREPILVKSRQIFFMVTSVTKSLLNFL